MVLDIVAAPSDCLVLVEPWEFSLSLLFPSWSPLGLSGISSWPGVPGSALATCCLFLPLLRALLLVPPLGRVLGVCGALSPSLPLPLPEVGGIFVVVGALHDGGVSNLFV